MKPKYELSQIINSGLSFCEVAPVITDKKIFNYIYKPNDDSFLLLYTIIQELQELKGQSQSPKVIAEIG